MLLFKISLLLALNVIQQDFTAETFIIPIPYKDLKHHFKLAPYKVVITSLKLCKVPYKRKNHELNVELKNMENGSQIAIGNYSVLKDTSEQVIPRFTLWIFWKNAWVRKMRQSLPSICSCNFCIKKMYSHFIITERVNSACLFKKGTKSFKYDPDEFVHNIFGDVAFFGQYNATLTYEARRSYYACLEVSLEAKAR